MGSVLPFDEINKLMSESAKETENSDTKARARKIADDLLSILILSYKYGVSEVEKALNVDVEDDIDEMYEIIFCKIDGKTFEDRVEDHIEEEAQGRLKNLAESEAHRVFEAAGFNTARKAEKQGRHIGKYWDTMQDLRVRETHVYLQGAVVGLNEEFYTFDGDHAMYPGGFQNVENNAGCRCHVIYVDIGQGRP